MTQSCATDSDGLGPVLAMDRPFVLEEIKRIVHAAELSVHAVLQRHRQWNAPWHFSHFWTSWKAVWRTASPSSSFRRMGDFSLMLIKAKHPQGAYVFF
ncbi:hypothetical protein Smed_6343 (plasmid) [Sinorhizobium medicae WSM419]|uniref:Uncharacterized protein n=1 Tax=Sinorhizobium medicae (strain WSM419) TaxID=366394 RepID=A6UMQ6_SINMW|nr:hypothetical protein Smed_6343 [Sinorhizobium medicae WSM419]